MAKNKSDNSGNTPFDDLDEQDVRDAHYFEDGVDEEGGPVETDEKGE